MKLSKDKTVALVSGLFGLFMLWQALAIKPTFPPTDGDCGPAVYPAFCCICLVLCAIGKFFFPTVKDSGKKFVDKMGWIKAGLMLLWLGSYTFALDYLGFIIASIPAYFLLIMLFTWEEKRNYLVAAITSLVFSFGAYYLFTDVLAVILPKGKLF